MSTTPSSLFRSLFLAGSALLGSTIAGSHAHAQVCDGNTPAASIVKTSCVVGGVVGPHSATPCKPNNATQAMVVGARTVEVTVCSKALRRLVKHRVLLPSRYYKESASRPSLYVLHGGDGNLPFESEDNAKEWLNRTSIDAVTYGTDTFVVSTEGGPLSWYSDWRVNPTRTVNGVIQEYSQQWETHFFKEVIPLLDQRFPNNGTRVIAGLSMGGMGALAYAARAKSLTNNAVSFRAAASFSGAVRTQANAVVPMGALLSKNIDPTYLWGDPTKSPSEQTWAQHDPYQLSQLLTNTPIWLYAANGSVKDKPWEAPNVGEALTRKVSLELADKQDATNSATPNSKGYVVRDLGVPSFGINLGCAGGHNWPFWDRALPRAWPFLRAHLLGQSPTKAAFPITDCPPQPASN